MTRWEYFSGFLRLSMKGPNNWVGKINGEEVQGVDEFCNFYGQDGWELVNVAVSGVSMILVFKRPLAELSALALPDFPTGAAQSG